MSSDLIERMDAHCRYLEQFDSQPMARSVPLMREAIERLTARKVGREEIEEAAHQAIVRWSNGEQPKRIKAMVADAIIKLLEGDS